MLFLKGGGQIELMDGLLCPDQPVHRQPIRGGHKPTKVVSWFVDSLGSNGIIWPLRVFSFPLAFHPIHLVIGAPAYLSLWQLQIGTSHCIAIVGFAFLLAFS